MAEFKKAIEKTLKPLARKVGSDIRNIESKVFNDVYKDYTNDKERIVRNFSYAGF